MQLDFKTLFRSAGKFVAENSPTILTSIGVAGVVTTAIFAGKGALKAYEIVADEDARRRAEWYTRDTGDIPKEQFPGINKKEILLMTWKCYIPAVASGALTITAVIGANRIGLRRQAALASAYTIADRALRKYEEKVLETLGPDKSRAIKEEINRENLERNPPSRTTIFVTEKGQTMIYDSLSDRYFYSDIDKIKSVVNDFNWQMINHDGFKPLNDFYLELGIPEIELGYDVGWKSDDRLLEIDYDAKLTDKGPCIVLNYRVEPRYL